MIEHLSIQGNQIQGEGSIVSRVLIKFEPHLLVHLAH